MQRRLDQWTTALSALLILGALLACKKKAPETTAPSAESVAATPTPAVTPPAAPTTAAAPTAPAEEAPKLGDVKRYPDKEKPQTGAVKILENDVKVFNEADDKTSDVATLDKDLLVFRLASIPDWELVEFPSGVGKVSPGWVLAKFLDTKADAKVERAAVATQAKQAVVKTPSTTPKTAASGSAKAAASGSAKPIDPKVAAEKAAAEKAAADKAAADKAAAEKAAAEAKAAAERAALLAKRAAEKAAKAAAAAAGGTAPK
jgi:hypothetical protein